MRFPLMVAFMMLLVNALVDALIYCIARRRLSRIAGRVQLVSSIAFFGLIILSICLPKRSGGDSSLVVVMWLLYAYITVYIPKYVYLLFELLANLPRLWKGRRWRAVSIAGVVFGLIVFFAMWWGALFNRFNIQVNKQDIFVDNLPESFHDFTIAQISDLHMGTFGTDTAFTAKLVDRVNSLNPDIILFTGDIVNRHSEELKPFVRTLSRLHAPYGVYSVLGNHDYGDYCQWSSIEEKEADVENLKKMQAAMGWHMLNNETAWIKNNNDSIALIGVENIGDPPFTVYGDLHKAYKDIGDKNVKILMSHNPQHWVDDIANTESNIVLTLSGHTHAMQICLFGISPAVLRYKTWGGVYTDSKGQNLYVNIGAGTVGMPYRIGATPEITLITLRENKK